MHFEDFAVIRKGVNKAPPGEPSQIGVQKPANCVCVDQLQLFHPKFVFKISLESVFFNRPDRPLKWFVPGSVPLSVAI